MVNRKTSSLLFLIPFTFACCSGAEALKRPDWVSGSSPRYPDALYLTGVGEGDSRSAAEDAARAQVAKNLRVEVSAKESYSMTETSSGEKTNVKSEAQATVSSKASELLEGLKIAEVFEESGKFYALAVLDRDQAAEKVDMRLKRAEALVDEGVTAGEIGDDFGALAKALKGLSAAKEREELAARRLAILPDEPLKDKEWELQKRIIKERLEKATVYLYAGGAQGFDEIKGKVMEILSGLGLKAGSKEGSALIIYAEMDMEPLERGDPKWKYLKGRAKVSLKDRGGNLRGETFFTAQGAGLNENQAYHKTLNALKGELDKEFAPFLMRALGGE
ncbi:MAG: hypothetical protein Kow0090_02200 [Myxococcota bacterium]